MYIKQSNAHCFIGVVTIYTIPIQDERPSLALSYNNVYNVVVLVLPHTSTTRNHRLARGYNCTLHQKNACAI